MRAYSHGEMSDSQSLFAVGVGGFVFGGCLGAIAGAFTVSSMLTEQRQLEATTAQRVKAERRRIKELDLTKQAIACNRANYKDMINTLKLGAIRRMSVANYDYDSRLFGSVVEEFQKEQDLCSAPVFAAFLTSKHPDDILDGLLCDKVTLFGRLSKVVDQHGAQACLRPIASINRTIGSLHAHPIAVPIYDVYHTPGINSYVEVSHSASVG